MLEDHPLDDEPAPYEAGVIVPIAPFPRQPPDGHTCSATHDVFIALDAGEADSRRRDQRNEELKLEIEANGKISSHDFWK